MKAKLTHTFIFLCFFVLTLSAQVINLDSFLVAHYSFDGNISDRTGNNGTGVAVDIDFKSDRFGNAESSIYFNGSSAFVNTLISFDFPVRTISAWFKADDLGMVGLPSELIPVIISQESNDLEWGSFRADLANEKINLTAGGLNQISNINVQPNQWHHFILERDSSMNRYYLDGYFIGGTPASDTGPSFSPNQNMVVGAGRGTANQFYSGYVDEIRIYNRLLSECEVELLANDALISPECLIVSVNDHITKPCKNSINLSPNPSINGIFRSDEAIGAYIISDVFGRTVQKGNSANQQIDLSQLKTGLYFLSLNKENENCYTKIKLMRL